jgi:signal-transduction protein with cAMP-binding, CBS, and nucleotidyltransferase domain
MTQSQS